MAKAVEVVLETGTGKNKSTAPVSAAISKLALEASDIKDRMARDADRLKEIDAALIAAYKPEQEDVRMEAVVLIVPERYRISVGERESRSVPDMDALAKVLGDRVEDLTETQTKIVPLKKLYEAAADPDNKLFKKLQGVVEFEYSFVVGYRATNK